MYSLFKNGFGITTFIVLAFAIISCSEKSSVKFEKMEDLKKQNRSPLNVVKFAPSMGVGDVILQNMMEDSGNLVMDRYEMKAFNISDQPIIGFDATVCYYNQEKVLIEDTSATTKLNYMETTAIQPGDSVELETRIHMPRGATAKLDIREVYYTEVTKFGDLTMKWKDRNYIEADTSLQKKEKRTSKKPL